MYGAYWVGMVLPNPLTSHANIAGVMGVEHVRYEGRLGVKRRRWTTGEIITDAYGHVRRLYARIRCFMGPIWHLVGPWEYRTMVGQLVLFRTLNGHVSGSHSSTPVSGIWTIITTHSTVSEGIVAVKDTSSHPIHGGK